MRAPHCPLTASKDRPLGTPRAAGGECPCGPRSGLCCFRHCSPGLGGSPLSRFPRSRCIAMLPRRVAKNQKKVHSEGPAFGKVSSIFMAALLAKKGPCRRAASEAWFASVPGLALSALLCFPLVPRLPLLCLLCFAVVPRLACLLCLLCFVCLLCFA